MYSTFKTKYGSPFSIKERRKDEEKNSSLFLLNKRKRRMVAMKKQYQDLKLACYYQIIKYFTYLFFKLQKNILCKKKKID